MTAVLEGTVDTLPQIDLNAVVSVAELEACGRMAYRIAHEVGNITAAVVGNAELIVRGADEGSPVRRRSGNIVRAMAQATDLATHMERFLGHPSRDDQPLDAAALVGGAEFDALLRALPRPVPVVVKVGGDVGSPRPYASLGRWRVALAALLANAADALVDHAGSAVVRTACATLSADTLAPLLRSPRMVPGPQVCLTVEDAGEGIADATLPHLFAPAFSTRLRQCGFGLSDVYGIVCRQHGGGIGLWTAPGKGTRVTLFLPADRPRPASLV